MTGEPRLRHTVHAALATLLSAGVLVAVLDGTDWLLRTAGAVGLVAAIGALGRWVRVPGPLTALLQLATVALYLTALYAPGPAAGGFLPGPNAWEALREIADSGMSEIDTFVPPVTATDGITLITIAGIAAVAVAVDLLAAGYRLPAAAGLPLMAIYLVPAAVLPEGVPGALFVLPALGYLALLFADGRARLLRWGMPVAGSAEAAQRGDAAARTTRRASADLHRLSGRVGVIAVALAIGVPAAVPALSDGAFGSGGIGNELRGNDTISTLNPLVDLRKNLFRPDPYEVLRVRSEQPAPENLYLRTVTLDIFDDDQWRAGRRRVQEFGEDLPEPTGLGEDVTKRAVRTRVEVGNRLASDYLPLPFPTLGVDIDGNWRVDPQTGNVVSQSGRGQISGRSYEVRSLELSPQRSDVQGSERPPDASRFLQLPGDLPERIERIARRVTKDAEGPLGKAIALQSWLRDPDNFTYDLSVRPGTGRSAILDFIDARRGYCEQFSSTMAVMARALGIPSRLNVGFTSGTPTADGLTRSISTDDAHAWPELYLSGVGWTRFEPTPGAASSQPAVPSWLQPQDAEKSSGQDTDDQEKDKARNSDTEQGSAPARGGGAPPPPSAGGGVEILDTPSSSDTSLPWWPFAVAALAAVGLAAVPALTRVAVRSRRWALAAASAGNAAADIGLRSGEAAWAELRDNARDLGYAWADSTTPRQASQGLLGQASLGSGAVDALHRVIGTVERRRYAPDSAGSPAPPDPDLRRDVDTVRDGLAALGTRSIRLRARLLPPSTLLMIRSSSSRAWQNVAGTAAARTRALGTAVRPARWGR